MLKLERKPFEKEVTITWLSSDKNSFLWRALAWACAVHFLALLLLTVKIISPTYLPYSSINVSIVAYPREDEAGLVVDEKEQIEESFLALDWLKGSDEVSFILPSTPLLALAPPISYDSSIPFFKELEQYPFPLPLMPKEQLMPKEVKDFTMNLSGEIAFLTPKAKEIDWKEKLESDSQPVRGARVRFHVRVAGENEESSVVWYDPIELSGQKWLDKELVELVSDLHFTETLGFNFLEGEVEFLIPGRRSDK